jgi:hypothetical protein
MKENVLIAVVSVLVGLMVGYLAWGAATQPGPMGSNRWWRYGQLDDGWHGRYDGPRDDGPAQCP